MGAVCGKNSIRKLNALEIDNQKTEEFTGIVHYKTHCPLINCSVENNDNWKEEDTFIISWINYGFMKNYMLITDTKILNKWDNNLGIIIFNFIKNDCRQTIFKWPRLTLLKLFDIDGFNSLNPIKNESKNKKESQSQTMEINSMPSLNNNTNSKNKENKERISRSLILNNCPKLENIIFSDLSNTTLFLTELNTQLPLFCYIRSSFAIFYHIYLCI